MFLTIVEALQKCVCRNKCMLQLFKISVKLIETPHVEP